MALSDPPVEEGSQRAVQLGVDPRSLAVRMTSATAIRFMATGETPVE